MPWATTTAPPTAATVLLRRRAESGMSGSFLGVGLDGGQHRLDGDAPAGDQLAPGVAYRRTERRGPQVFPYEHGSRAARLDCFGEVGDVLLAEHHRQVFFVPAQL